MSKLDLGQTFAIKEMASKLEQTTTFEKTRNSNMISSLKADSFSDPYANVLNKSNQNT